MHSRFAQTGFTLPEILVVIAIVGVLATLAMVTFSSQAERAALDSSYATVLTALDSTRAKSMQGAGDGSVHHAVGVAADGRSITANGIAIPLSPDITVTEGAGKTITFERISGATTPLTLELSAGDGTTRTITITDHGYVY
jgi:prepilin-type N-terminal cleavage/methylation domain-containing protein